MSGMAINNSRPGSAASSRTCRKSNVDASANNSRASVTSVSVSTFLVVIEKGNRLST